MLETGLLLLKSLFNKDKTYSMHYFEHKFNSFILYDVANLSITCFPGSVVVMKILKNSL